MKYSLALLVLFILSFLGCTSAPPQENKGFNISHYEVILPEVKINITHPKYRTLTVGTVAWCKGYQTEALFSNDGDLGLKLHNIYKSELINYLYDKFEKDVVLNKETRRILKFEILELIHNLKNGYAPGAAGDVYGVYITKLILE